MLDEDISSVADEDFSCDVVAKSLSLFFSLSLSHLDRYSPRRTC
jgi:hypothetical protein